MRKTSSEAAATDGASVLLNRYGLLRWRRRDTTSALPVVYPPVAPPSAFPRVELMMSTCDPRTLSDTVPSAAPPALRAPVTVQDQQAYEDKDDGFIDVLR